VPDPRGDLADGGYRQNLYVFTGGFLWNRQVRRILALAGYDLKISLPRRGADRVAVWGRTPRSGRGRAVARWRDAGIVTVEDAFLRSVRTGRAGAPPMGLVIDTQGAYFDCNQASDLEDLLNFAALDDPALLARAEGGIQAIRRADLSKYNAHDPALAIDATDYVLVIDQTAGDASIRYGGADKATFAAMLAAARRENPDSKILIKTHPETTARFRRGHFTTADQDARTELITAPVSPQRLLAGASRVYCVTSLMGFEAIMAGHRPRVFGKPFYGGWGLSDDETPPARRARKLSRAALFAGAMLIYPVWYDPYRRRLCEFETVVENLSAQARAWREDRHGYVALGMRLWKRHPLRRFFAGPGTRITFREQRQVAGATGRPGLVWAGKETDGIHRAFRSAGQRLGRVEDGFLRSRGLGANLVPPLSLVVDDLGIYYDPTRESRLERLLNEAGDLTDTELARAKKLRAGLISGGVSKYNIGAREIGAAWPRDQTRILVPGQVEDDASIRLGAGDIRRNIDLLARTRVENRHAFIAYKPHPDVEAGLRIGAIDDRDALAHADVVLRGTDAIAAINACDAVWTITSLLGFEALLRGKAVTCLGTPFYAGWGLTDDLGPGLARRVGTPSLAAMVHAVLIAYPRYFDPVTGLACPPEVLAERLAGGRVFAGGLGIRLLAKAQGAFATFAPLWR